MKTKLIDDKDLSKIEKILTRWDGKLTWDEFSVAVARTLSRPTISKFTLMRYPAIKDAFNQRKNSLRDHQIEVHKSGDMSFDELLEENYQLRNQIKHLEMVAEQREKQWLEQFRRWQYNLSQMPGVDMYKLNRGIDRALPGKSQD